MNNYKINYANDFNIFKILEKDDKEIIHSAFIKFMLDRWGSYFYFVRFTFTSITNHNILIL